MGVTVTVLTWPVTVSRDVTGDGVHVDEEDEDEDVVCDINATGDGVVDVVISDIVCSRQ